MMMFVANCVATVLVIYPTVALATWVVHRDSGVPR